MYYIVTELIGTHVESMNDEITWGSKLKWNRLFLTGASLMNINRAHTILAPFHFDTLSIQKNFATVHEAQMQRTSKGTISYRQGAPVFFARLNATYF